MNKIEEQVTVLKKEKRLGLMTHVIVGYPSVQDTYDIVKLMAKEGVDFIELQIPFSDPIADGPTIMKACEIALAQGVTVADAFSLMERLTKEVAIPLLFMCYFNTVFVYGVEQFCKKAQEAGCSGLIVPDMPLEEEETEHFFAACKKYNLIPIHVISPASTGERLQKNATVAKGFVYATARQGTTDAKKKLDPKVSSYLTQVRKVFSVPVAVGFGISSNARVKMIRPYTDIAVVGSAIVDCIATSSKRDMHKNVKQFIQSLGIIRKEKTV